MGSAEVKRLLVLAAWAAAGASASAAPVADPIDRPAVSTRLAQHAMLLGAARAGERLVVVGERGIVVLSDDGGATWRQARVPVSVTLTAVRFPDAKHGYAVGHGGVVLSSEDAGESWTKRFDGMQAARIMLRQAQARGDAASMREAERLVADGADKPFLDLHFFDARRGLVVGAYNLAFYTEDGGQTWQSWMERLDNPKSLHLYAVRAKANRILVAGEQGLVLSSEDAGRSFKRLDTPYHGSFFTAELIAENGILLAGMRGNVWRSGDGGGSWTQIALPDSASVTASSLRSPQELVLVNQSGMVFVGPAGGGASAWRAASTPGLPPLNGVLPLAGGLLVLSGQGVTLLGHEQGISK